MKYFFKWKEFIYLILLLTTVLLVLVLFALVPATIRRLNIICPRRANRGGVGEDIGEWEEGDAGSVGVISSSAIELRRRLWLDETHEVQAEAIAPRRRRFFVDFVNVAIVVDDDDVIKLFVVVFRWFRTIVAEGRRDEILGVELFRRV